MKSKLAKILLIASLAHPVLALAETPRADRLVALSQKLALVESQLNAADLQALDFYLGGIDSMLSHYAAASQLVCISNGQDGVFERFTITDPITDVTYGQPTTLDTCKQLITSQTQGLICVSNGQDGVFERFGAYEMAKSQQLGGFTQLKTCQSLVTSARPALMCLSNGQDGVFEKFHLYNRVQGKVLGGDTGLDQCLGSIPGA